MTNEHKPKLTLTEEMFSSFALRKNSKEHLSSKAEPGTSYEVFRNNTTAVEVIVKEVPNRNSKKEDNTQTDDKNNNHNQEIEKYKNELNRANRSFQKTKTGFKIIIEEMKRIIDEANHREIEMNAKVIALEIENEKLKALIQCKCNSMNKFKRELNSIKKSLKYFSKRILKSPKLFYNVTEDSDVGYIQFESDLSNDFKVKFALTDDGTFDSSISKGMKNSFEKN